ncbi:MAG: TatD family hydrolase [Opitutales bacterium]|nr:TatD family hydrolase [Opitutales bacterium]
MKASGKLPEVFDAHFHPQDSRLDPVRLEWLLEAESAGVQRGVVNGTHPGDWDQVTELCQRFPALLPAYGLHPWKVADASPDWRELLTEKLDSGACCVGEFGLDRWIENPDLEAQVDAFRWHWEQARARALPATVHCLRAWGLLLEQLKRLPPLPQGFLLHSYSGSPELIDELLPHGAWFSFSATILQPRKEKARVSFEKVPLDRLLLETDAPDMLPPEDFCYGDSFVRGLHHPASLVQFYRKAAEMRGLAFEEFCGQLRSNFYSFFQIVEADSFESQRP